MNKSQGKLGKNRMGAMKDKVVLLIVPVLFLLGFYAGRHEPVQHVVAGGEAYFAPGIQCENRIVEEITKAQDIDIAICSLTSPMISNALIGAQKRGAEIPWENRVKFVVFVCLRGFP